MRNNTVRRPWVFVLIGAAALLAAAGFGVAFGPLPGLSAAASLTLTAALGAVWVSRVGAARRWAAALDEYARREIARGRRASGPRAAP